MLACVLVLSCAGMAWGAWISTGDASSRVTTQTLVGRVHLKDGQLALEYPGASIADPLTVSNDGAIDAYVRVRIRKAWLDAGEVRSDLDTGYIALDTQTSGQADWRDGGDGWFYYRKVLSPGETTTPLFKTITLDKAIGNAYAACTVRVCGFLECIQATSNAARALWGQTFDAEGSFGTGATASSAVFTGPGGGFTFTPDKDALMGPFRNVLPGESYTRTFTVGNAYGSSVTLRLRARLVEQGGDAATEALRRDFLQNHVTMRVMRADGMVLYEGPAWSAGSDASQLLDAVLGTFDAGASQVLTVTLSVDAGAGNAYEGIDATTIGWELVAMGAADTDETSSGSGSSSAAPALENVLPKTGDPRTFLPWVLAALASGVALLLLAAWRRRREAEAYRGGEDAMRKLLKDLASSRRTSRRATVSFLISVSLVLCMLCGAFPQRAWAATGSGDSVHLLNGNSNWSEATTLVTPAEIATNIALWGNTGYQGALGGMALMGTTTFDASSFAAGTLEKHITRSSSATGAGTLNLTGASSLGSTSGNLLIEGVTVHLSGGSSLSTATGTITLKNCTVIMDGTSSISVSGAGSVVLDGCAIQGGSIKAPSGASIVSASGYTNTISGSTVTLGASSYLTNAGTLNLTGATVDGGNASRTTAGIRATAGTINVTNSTIENFNNTNASALPGGAFDVSSGATVNFGTNGSADTSQLKNCFAAAASNLGSYGGAAAFIASGGTFNLKGGTVSACGVTTADQYQNGPFSVLGTFNMSGGAISGCKGSHGGALCLATSTAQATISGGTISNNTCYYDGGAVFNTGKLTVSGGTISNNTAGRNGAAIGHRSGSTTTITGGTITGNNTTGSVSSSTVGAISGFTTSSYGAVTISGNPTISGNTFGGTTKADLAVYSTTSLTVAGMGTGASVGICSPTATYTTSGNQFATATGTATNVNQRAFFDDANSSLVAVSGGGTVLKWAPVAKYKIVGSGGTTAYGALADALVDANAATTDTTIQMLVASDALTAQCTAANANSKTTTIKTAKTTDTDGYPYTGTTSPGIISRGATYGSMFALTKGGLALNDITLDGAKASYSSTASGGIVNAAAGCTLALGSGATLKNSTASANGGAVYITGSGARMTMADGSAIRNCATTSTYAGGIFQGASSTFEATGGTITGCAANAANASGGAIMQDAGAANVTTILGGTFIGSGNSAYANGTFIHGGGTGSTITVKDTAQITGNTKSGNSYTGAAIFPNNATVAVKGSPTITGNTQLDGSAMNVYVDATSKLDVTGDLTSGTVGVYGTTNYYENTKQFGYTTASSAAGVSGLSRFVNDRNPVGGMKLIGKAGTGNAVVWGQAVCKIVRDGVAIPFSSLADAMADARDGETIQMIVPSYEMTSTVALAMAKAVTITTAKTTDTDGYPYAGAEGTPAVLLRATAFTGSFFSASAGTLRFTDITLDGNVAAGASATTGGGFVSVSGSANVTLASGATMRNAASSYSGTCITGASSSTGTITIENGASISNCSTSDVNGSAAVCLWTGSHLVMTGGSITGCSSTGGKGSAISLIGTDVTFDMSGGSITGTDAGVSSPTGSAAINIDSSSTNVVNLSGTAAITGNGSGGICMWNGSQVNVADSVRITGNTRSGTAANIIMMTPGSKLGITSPLSSQASIGVTVTSGDHADGYVFAQAGSETVAAASFARFTDDRTPALAITYDGTGVKFQDYAYLTIAKTFDVLTDDNATPSALFRVTGTVSGAPFTYYQQVVSAEGTGNAVIKIPCGTYDLTEVDAGWRYSASGTATFTGAFTAATALSITGCDLTTADTEQTATFGNSLQKRSWLSGHSTVENTTG